MGTTRHPRYELFGLLALAFTFGGCIHTPSGASQQSTDPVTFRGATLTAYEHVDLYLRDRRGAEVGVAPVETPLAVASTASSPSRSGFYDLSVTIPTSALPASAWAPQEADGRTAPGSGLRRSVGRLEIVARPRIPGAPNLKTFTQAALPCVLTAPNREEALDCADGDSFLVYDNDGVGINGAAPAAADFVKIRRSPFAVSELRDGVARDIGVELEIGAYDMPELRNPVNAVVCRPTAPLPRRGLRTVVLNHGGFVLDGGALDACVNWARAGWLAALSAYRFEAITALGGSGRYIYPPEIERPGTSDLAEFCLGEVTDALRWLDIVRARTDTDDAQILMWGYSHGACVTLRSLEQGAKVKAAVTVAAPTEFFRLNNILTNTNRDLALFIQNQLGGTPETLPDAYRARSAARMAVDLVRRSDVRLLQIAVERDTVIHPSQSCLMAGAIGAENHLMRAGGEYLPSAEPPLGVNFAGCGFLPWTGAPVNWNQRAVFLLYYNIDPRDGHIWFGYTTPPPLGEPWDIPLNMGIRDFLQASFP